MNLLLDTCTFIWLAAEPKRIGRKARKSIDAHNARLLLSDASIWEVCLKWQAGKIELPDPPRQWFAEQVAVWQVERVGLEPEHFYRVTELPVHHKDPFDRLLVAQAIEHGLTVVSPDEAFHDYPVAVLW